MAHTPSKETQTIQFLYAVLTINGNPNVDWEPICTALDLEKGAATKRWSRLKQSMEKQEKVAASNQDLLWLMIKHSERGTGFDWQAVAEKCGSTKGAVSKRYSRMKLAFERGDAPPPSTPTKTKRVAAATPKKTPAKIKVKSEDDAEDTLATTPKRKRTPSTKKADCNDPAAADDEVLDEKPKRAKSTPKAKPRPRNAFRARDGKTPSEESRIVVKSEPGESDGDVFADAREHVDDAGVDAEGEVDEICKSIHPSIHPYSFPARSCAVVARRDGCGTASICFSFLWGGCLG